MSQSCQESRELWLERLSALEAEGVCCQIGRGAEGDSLGIDHLEACGECAAWLRRTALHVRGLRELSPLAAPAELEARLFRPPVALVEGALVEGPERIAEEPLAIQVVRALDRLSAPPVLERLVAEELAGAAAARAERFAGDLEHLPAPRKLEGRVLAELRRQMRPRRLVGPVATLVAAAVLVWIGVGRFTGTPESSEPSYSFVVERPGSLDDLDPYARNLAEILGGSSRRSG